MFSTYTVFVQVPEDPEKLQEQHRHVQTQINSFIEENGLQDELLRMREPGSLNFFFIDCTENLALQLQAQNISGVSSILGEDPDAGLIPATRGQLLPIGRPDPSYTTAIIGLAVIFTAIAVISTKGQVKAIMQRIEKNEQSDKEKNIAPPNAAPARIPMELKL